MSFWQQAQSASGMGGSLGWLIALFVVVLALVFAFFPAERMRIRTAFFMFALSLGGLAIAVKMTVYGQGPDSSFYKWFHWASGLLLGIAVVNVASVLIFDLILANIRLPVPRILRDLLLAGSYIVIAISLLSRHGVDLTGIIATSTVVTAIIGLSFQDTLGNVMGGLALQMERTIHTGDWIRIDQVEGRVQEIRWRYTAIETRNWDTVVIPNSALMKAQVVILGRRSGQPVQHRQWVYFNVDFRFQPPDVIAAVETALCADPIPNVASNPKPNCVFMDYKESFASYAVRYWLTDFALDAPTDSVVRERIFFALRRSDIAPSIPAHSVFLTDDSQSRRKRKLEAELEHRIETLKRVELFHTLTDEEFRELVPHIKPAPFLKGEVITKQGSEAHWLYIITEGAVEVEVTVEETGLKKVVSTLREGDFFGEGGMMTGERRTATVRAISDVECYRLDKEAFKNVITRRKEIAEDISMVMAKRRVELDAIKEGLDEEAKQARLKERHGDILHRMLNFSGQTKTLPGRKRGYSLRKKILNFVIVMAMLTMLFGSTSRRVSTFMAPVLGAGVAKRNQIRYAARMRRSSLVAGQKRLQSLSRSAVRRDFDAKHGYIQYRYGLPDKVELEFPSARTDTQKQFLYAHYFRAQVDETEISFNNGDYNYRIFDYYQGDQKPVITTQGLTVTPPGTKKASTEIQCVARAKADYAAVSEVLPCDPDSTIAPGGCP